MVKRGKNYREKEALIDASRAYPPDEAVRLAKQCAFARFDETVELHVRTALDPRNAEQQLRGTALLPHGLGKKVRILVFAEGEAARVAKEQGAEHVGGDELIKKVEDGWTDFDVALAQREMMGRVGKLGRVLGPRGLMPSPRSGTVVDGQDIGKAVQDAAHGKVEFRLDRTAILHVPIGKASFTEEHLLENLATLVHEVEKARPSGAKGQFIRSITLTTTMGPSIKLDPTPTMALTPN
jgi:large subunit ribosomal protein L1